MHKAIVFGNLQNLHTLVVCDGVSALGFNEVVGHIAHADAPVTIVVGATLFEFLTAVTTRADAYRQMALITLQPVGDMLDVSSLVHHADGFLYRDDVHADTRSTHRHHWGDFFQRQECHAFKEHSQFRMLVHQFNVHIGVFRAARNEHRHPIDAILALERGASHRTIFGVFVAVVVFQHAEVSQFVEQLVKGLVVLRVVFLSVPFHQFGVGMMLAHRESLVANDVKQQVERGLACLGIHLVFKDAG